MTTEITFKSIPLTVEGYYDAGEEGVRYFSDMSGLPPTPSSFEVNAVFIGDIDCFELFSGEDLDRIEELVIEKIEG